jgi:Fe-S cluster assembly protein SufB
MNPKRLIKNLDKYPAGFNTKIKQDQLEKGLNEDIIRQISAKKKEPKWLLDYRLKAYTHFLKQKPPTWAQLDFQEIDFQDIIYYSAPKTNLFTGQKDNPKSLDDVDPEILKTFEKLGISLNEQKRLTGVAVDVVFDSVSVKTTFEKELLRLGIIFCSISEAVQKYPDLVQKYLGSVVPFSDNFYASLNAAVFSDGTFAYIPKNTKCPMELSTYFRINAENTGQFERTLIVVEEGSSVSYLEGCTAPMRDKNQLHAAVVELIANKDSEIKYSTVQNWYPGDKNGVGGIYNFVTKRGICKGDNSKISWTQVETGSSITWKYPSVILKGDNSIGEFYSVALTKNKQQADTGTKMIHIGKNTRSRIISKGISAGQSKNTYRGLVKITSSADNARNFTQCDSLLLSQDCEAFTYPTIDSKNASSITEHEASATNLSEEILEYLQAKGLNDEETWQLVIGGFCNDIIQNLPMEFLVEAKKLVTLDFGDSVG